MDLRRRCGRERLVLDRGEQLLRRAVELVLDHLPRVVPREGRGVALELGQFLDHLRRQHVAAAGDHLADLHVGRPELLQQLAEAGRARHDDQLGLAEDDPREPPSQPPDRRRVEGRVEGDGVDDLVDLLEAQVLEDQVAARRRQRIEQPPDRRGPPGGEHLWAVQAEHRARQRGEERVEGGDREEPQQLRLGRARDVGRHERRDPDHERVHDDHEEAERGQEEAPGERDDHRADEPLGEDEDRGGDQHAQPRPDVSSTMGARSAPNGNGWGTLKSGSGRRRSRPGLPRRPTLQL